MESDYAGPQLAQANMIPKYAGLSAQGIKAATPLDRVSAAADRVERLAYNIETFNDRFYTGATPETAAACRPVPSGHDGQIARLHDALDRLDTAVQRLQTIG